MEYGDGLRVEWSRREAACIVQAHARRQAEAMMGLPRDSGSRASCYRQNPGLEQQVENEVWELLRTALEVGRPVGHRERYGT